jgi:hypothetical protein
VSPCSVVDDRSVDLQERTTEAFFSPAPEATPEMAKSCGCAHCGYRPEKPKTPCIYGYGCNKRGCKYAHACKLCKSTTRMPVGVGKVCPDGIACPHLKCKFAHPSPSLECCALLSNGGTHHAVRSTNVKEADLDDDTVVKAIIAIVDLLGSGKEVEQGRIGSALSKKEREVSLSLLTLCVYPEALCHALYFRNRSVLSSISLRTLLLLLVSFFFETEDVHQREVRLYHEVSFQRWRQEMVSCQRRWCPRVCFLGILLQI